MHLARTHIMGLALFLGLGTAGAQAQSLTTTYAADNAQYGVMFNVVAKTALTIDSLDVHFQDANNPAPCGGTCSVVEVEVYNVTGGGGVKPVLADPSSWTLIGTAQHTVTTGVGSGQPLSLPIDLAMDPAGIFKYGLYVTSTGASNTTTGLPNEFQHYTGTGNPPTTDPFDIYENADLQILEGWGIAYPFGTSFKYRAWNGTMYYTTAAGCGGGVTSYCTAGSSASGCQATLSTSGTPSESATSGFTVTATNIEGNKDGLFFVGTNGAQANAWGNGTSFQCVVPPVKRFGLLATNGTNFNCDGTKSQDFNAYWNTFPAKNPGAGTVANAQLWYRDPLNSSNQTTSLSDAIEFTVCP